MSMLGNLFGSTDSDAENYLNQALQQYQSLNVPTVASETINSLPQETVQGTINPEQQQAVTQGQSELNNIKLDPANIQAQKNALAGYTDIANSGGLDANAKLGIQQAINAANIQSQGAQGALQQQAQAEGQGGGLNALVMRQNAAQNASNVAANQGLQQAALAEANRENALSQMANIGNTAQNTQYGELANTAASQNDINAANTGIKNQVNATNVGNNLTAQGANIANAQGVNASNTAAGQNQAYYNAQLPQQQFNNALSKASGAAGVLGQQANAAQQAAQNSANAGGQLLKGGLTLGATALGGPLAGAAANMLSSGARTGGTGAVSGWAPPKSANTQQYAPFADGGKVEGVHPILQDIIDKYNGINHVQGPENGIAVQQDANGHKTPVWYETAAEGMKVPGKAEVEGDSPKNDKVPAMLSPGEIVIKRSKASNPDEAAKEAKKISMEEFMKDYKRGKK